MCNTSNLKNPNVSQCLYDPSTPFYFLGLFYCFSCATGGDIITFVQKLEMCSYKDAVQKIVLLEKLDINIENTNDGGRASGLYNQQKKIENILKLAAIYYTSKMGSDPNAMAARKHLISRKIRPDTAFKFQIGYAPRPTFPSGSPFKDTGSDGRPSSESITANLTGVVFCQFE